MALSCRSVGGDEGPANANTQVIEYKAMSNNNTSPTYFKKVAIYVMAETCVDLKTSTRTQKPIDYQHLRTTDEYVMQTNYLCYN